jgi:hypothetical protein
MAVGLRHSIPHDRELVFNSVLSTATAKSILKKIVISSRCDKDTKPVSVVPKLFHSFSKLFQ